MLKLRAFLNGMLEFRTSWTTNYPDDALMETYDRGRDPAHRLTFRRYEER